MLAVRIVLGIYLVVHGLSHFVGFVVPFKIVTLEEEPYKTTLLMGKLDVGDVGIRVVGVFWLAAGLAFIAAAAASFAGFPWWYPLTQYGTAFSLILCVLGLEGAKIGILANAIILVYLFLGARFGWLPAV